MRSLSKLFNKNVEWARKVSDTDPEFFSKLVGQQSPDYLWIGCADSRVPANEIVDLLPGELFVHRNVANVVVHTDLNCLSVLQYAVDVLDVEHVIVCGHYGCGGVQAALEHRRLGLIDNWLRHVQDVADRHRAGLDGIAELAGRLDRLCELNVLEQARNVAGTTIVQDAWARGQRLTVHAWIYRLDDGLLRDLRLSVRAPGELEERSRAALAALASDGAAPSD